MNREEVRDDRPWSEQRGASEIDGRWLLTHGIWHPTLPWGGHGSEYETGVRFLDQVQEDGRPRFELIQHGWKNFRAAGDIIERGLRKAWTPGRITDFMRNLDERRVRFPKSREEHPSVMDAAAVPFADNH